MATGTFFWIAHVYADLLADRIKGHHRMGRHAIGTVWPGNGRSSSRASCSPFRSRSAPRRALSAQLALDLAWLGGIAALVGWGVVFSRKEGHGLVGIIVAATLNAAVGLVIVGLKVAVR